MEQSYKLFLYKPSGEFLGELIVKNLNVDINLDSVSTINFDIPEYINNRPNVRVNDVLDNYEVELWYGRLDGIYNKDFYKIRFFIYSTPLDFNNHIVKFSYTGFSKESILEYRNIVSWPGVEKQEYFREIMFYKDDNEILDTFKERNNLTVLNFVSYNLYSFTQSNITYKVLSFPLSANANLDDLYIYQVRATGTGSSRLENEHVLIQYPDTVEINGSNQISSFSGITLDRYHFIFNTYLDDKYAHLIMPDDYRSFNINNNQELFFRIFDNPTGKRYSQVYQYAEEDIAELRNYIVEYERFLSPDKFEIKDGVRYSICNYNSKDGLKLKEILLGTIDSSITTPQKYGILYDSGFSIGTISAEVENLYRSNIDINNNTIYQTIKNLATTFECIPIYDTIEKTVSFYKDLEYGNDNGLIIKYGTYLKSINKDIDSSKIITYIKALGKDNIDLNLISPNGDGVWEDYTYYLDDFGPLLDEHALTIVNGGYEFNTYTTNIVFNYDGLDLNSRWMSYNLAKKIFEWQYTRNYIHKVMMGEEPGEENYDYFYDLYAIRKNLIESLTKEETRYYEKYADTHSLKYLYEHYKNLNDSKDAGVAKEQININGVNVDAELYYSKLYTESLAAAEVLLDNVNDYKTDLNALDSKFNLVRNLLNKNLTINEKNEFNLFKKESVFSDSKYDNDFDLLEGTIKYCEDNKYPKVTFNIGVADILGAAEAKQDWNKVKVGEKLNLFFPKFNVDLLAQIKNIKINFDNNSLSLTISNIKDYARSFGEYLSRLSLKTRELIVDKFQYKNDFSDLSFYSYNVTRRISKHIDTRNTSVNLGASDINGNTSGSATSDGIVYNTSSPNTLLETFTVNVDGSSSAVLNDGGLVITKTLENDDKVKVDISANSGFILSKYSSTYDQWTKQMYIDTDGNAFFAGDISAATGKIGGWDIGETSLTSGTEANGIGLSTSGDYAFWAGDSTPDINTPFSVTPAGLLTATNANITGIITATSGSFTGEVNISTNGILRAGDVEINSNGITNRNWDLSKKLDIQGTIGSVYAKHIGLIDSNGTNIELFSYGSYTIGSIINPNVLNSSYNISTTGLYIDSDGSAITIGKGTSSSAIPKIRFVDYSSSSTKTYKDFGFDVFKDTFFINDSINIQGDIIFEGTTEDDYETILSAQNATLTTGDIFLTLPTVSGTILSNVIKVVSGAKSIWLTFSGAINISKYDYIRFHIYRIESTTKYFIKSFIFPTTAINQSSTSEPAISAVLSRDFNYSTASGGEFGVGAYVHFYTTSSLIKIYLDIASGTETYYCIAELIGE